MGLGIAASIGKAWRLFASYDGEFKSDQIDTAVTGGVQYRWQG
jgi:outer membrane autotransporter protein